MKQLKRIATLFLIVLVLGLILVVTYVSRKAKNGLPDYKKDLQLEGLIYPVKVIHDSMGIPHIYAKNETDLYRATGYIMAQERLWQMDLLRRVTLGRLSEIFGDDFVETDLLLRSLQYSEKSNSILNNTDPKILSTLTAFSDGVNQYIADNEGNYPLEFFLLNYIPEKWEPYQSLNLIGYMAWDLKSGWDELILEKLSKVLDSAQLAAILPNIKIKKSIVYGSSAQEQLLTGNKILSLSKLDHLGLDILSGSSNWAISPAKSNTGSAILANDMHLSFGVPGIWMQIHQCIPGSLNVSGLALPGAPLIIVGHNDSIAWGMTNVYVDNLDYYEEKINPKDSNQYYFNGEWKNFDVKQEIILSKSGKTFHRTYRLNHRGPVVSSIKKIKDRVLTIRWVGDLESNEFLSMYKVNRSHNWNEFKEAFTTFKSISQNIVYADCRGNIGLYCCAGIPIRKRDKIFAVLPGDTSEYDWQGLVPFNELPHTYNPPCGYLVSANNQTTGPEYPYHIGTWYSQPYRYERIVQLIEGKQKLGVDDFKLLQNDMNSEFMHRFMLHVLPEINSGADFSEPEKLALTILNNWNYSMAPDQTAAAIGEILSWYYLKNTFSDELGNDLFNEFCGTARLSRIAMFNIINDSNSVWTDNVLTKERESRTNIANQSFKQTVAELIEKVGDDTSKWHWGNFHGITLKHPLAKVAILDRIFHLNRGPFAVGGSYHTVSPYSFPLFKPAEVEHGASHRNIFNVANWDGSWSVIPTGNSGICRSEFYCNQTEMYIKGEYHYDYFSTARVEKIAKYTMLFLPK